MSSVLKTEATSSRRALLAEHLRRAASRRRRRPLSFAQQRLWFLDQLEPNSSLYNVATIARVEGTVNTGALEDAINAVISRHEALRTHFASSDENAEQIIEPSLKLSLRLIEVSGREPSQGEADRLIKEEINRPFDLATGPLVRATLITVQPGEYLFALIFHHIVADEWSLKVFFHELGHFYKGFATGEKVQLAEPPIQYADYAEWQRDWLEGEILQQQLQYWKTRLGNNPPLTELPTDYPRQTTPSFKGGTCLRWLGTELSQKIAGFARQRDSTPFMVLLAAVKALLCRYTAQQDIVIGAPIAGRNRVETENLIGFFVNTLLLRTSLNGDPPFEELVQRVRETTLGAYAHQDLPFEKLIEELQPERSLSHMPLARIMFLLQNDLWETLQVPGATFHFLPVESDTAKFELTFLVQETSQGLMVRAEYNRDLFEPASIERLLGHYQVLLEGAMAEPARRLSQLPLLTELERHQLLVEWNRTESVYPTDKCIHQIFEAQAASNPDTVAVTFGDSSITYRELNLRANQLANYLRRFQIGPDVPVCICVRRSVGMVIGLLGILKAGGAYVPLDPRYPKERLDFMLRDTQAPVLLTEQDLLPCLPSAGGKIISLDADWELIAREDIANNPCNAQPENLAYIMYTSGSTGQPKGVAVPHRAVNRLVLNTNYLELDASARIAQVSNFSFDAATFEIWGSLLNGARLVGITRDVALSPKEFAQELRQEGITAMFLTSALFNQLAAEAPGAFETVRTLIAGGEALDPKWVRAVLNDRPPRRLLNGYGPTENTTFTCCHLIQQLPEAASSVPIGRPISNTRIYILDRHLNPVPVGVPGELYTGGDGLARGYWNRPELTAEKFIPDPLSPTTARQVLYKTGDLARFLPDGSVEFLGRIDQQVKIRGFRIELGEIETVLGRHPAVRECVVTVSGTGAGDRRLIAYIVAAAGAPPPNASELRSFLLERLPEYMVPSAFLPLPALPLTDNSKVDRKALPAPDQARPELEPQYAPPTDQVEIELVRIWENVLNVRPIGIHDKFFELGGHSLLAVRVVNQIEKAFQRKLRLATIFQAPTIQQLAAVLRQEIKETSLTQGSSVVEIQAKGSGPPLFLVHGAGGGMFWGYANLSRHLGPGQPIYGFKSRGLDGREELDKLEQIAAQYVADLRQRQPNGPYYLGGYCFGGIVAFEMARQLSAAGQEVRFLGLLNCAPPNSSYTRIPWSFRWGLRLLRNLVYWANYCRQWTGPQRREFLRWKWSLLKKRLLHRQIKPDANAGLVEAGDIVDLSAFTAEQRRVWEAHIRAMLKYQPGPYPGRVHLFRSPGHPIWCSFDDDYGWGEFAQGGVQITVVPGAHEKILEDDCAAILAAEVMKALNQLRVSSAPESVPDISSELRGPEVCFPLENNYARQFAIQAKRAPGALAVSFSGEHLTYAQLEAQANRLGHFLQAQGVGPEVLVAVCLERSLDLPVALLAVTKSGGAYVPLDPEYPAERLAYMLEDCRPAVLVTRKKFLSVVGVQGARRVICLDDPEEQKQLQACPVSPPLTRAEADHLAYVIYTSGSTGAPKGVEITQRSLLNHNFAIAEAYALTGSDRVLQFAPLSFDISVEEIFPTWLAGATVVLRTDDAISSAAGFLDHVARQAITVLNLPTAFWHELIEFMHGSGASLPASVRLVITGGEKVSDHMYLRWKECTGGSVALMNGYGVTEATVTTTVYKAGLEDQTLPIGRPIANAYALVLDEQLRPVRPGSTGELFIGGAGVARGYLNRPELTRQRFMAHPLRPETAGRRLYRTGDLVRLRSDGNLEFLGRVDDQVKIRGYRVELGEIEAALRLHPEIKEVVVVASADKQSTNRLVAYVVPRTSPGPQKSSLAAFLKTKLPAYMVPSAFVTLPSLPLSPAGKLDRRLLPPPASSRPELAQSYLAARNKLEETLAALWSEVLSISPVGVHDNFFDLGGHSLLAMQLLSRIREHLHLEVPLSSLFSKPTIAQLAGYLAQHAQPLPGLPPGFKGRKVPLSPRQRRIWFLDSFEARQSPYNRAIGIHLFGPLQVPTLKRSLSALVRRSEALRAIFPAENGEPTQYIAEPLDIQLPIIEVPGKTGEARKAQARQRAACEAARRHITSEPLLRPLLFRFSATEHWLVLVLHEIGADSHSLRLMLEDLGRLYDAFMAQQPEPPPPPQLPFAEALRLTAELPETRRSQELDFWKRQLAGAPPLLELPTDRPRPEHRSDAGARQPVWVPPEVGRTLERLSIQAGCSLSTVLLGGFAAVLHRYTAATDILIGSPVQTRPYPELKQVVGPFENNVALRCNLAGDPGFRELLARLNEAAAGAFGHSALPFCDLLEELHPERNPTFTPVFQVLFALDDEPLPEYRAGDVVFQPFEIEKHSAQLDLTLRLARTREGALSGWLEYNTSLFDSSRIARLEQHLLTFLKAAAANPTQPISAVPLLPESELKLLRQFNGARHDYPRDKTALDFFLEQAEHTPAATALVSGTQRLSYRELYLRAARIAVQLRAAQVGKDTLVGICLERSADTIAALLATWMSGAAYVPLDPAYPKERLEFIARDAKLKILITSEKLRKNAPSTEAQIFCLEVIDRSESDTNAATIPLESASQSAPQPADLAYVIYTSGSTGRPKGVAIEHRSAAAFVSWARNFFSANELAGVLASTSICFDLSIFEIFVPLSCGGTVLLAENALALPTLAAAHEVTLINTVPSAIRELLRIKGVPPSVRVINLAGEPLAPSLVDQIYAQTPAEKVYDLYGPSETTTYSTVALRRPGMPATIGRPLPNEQIFLLDRHLQLVPVGVPGELYIGGAGLARGYLNRPELTAERFIPHPFQPGERLYKTGDLARWRDDGTLEYLGRLDYQVKIRGFRIELGEIESVLKSCPQVRDAVVIAREECPGDKRLAAFLVGDGQRQLHIDALREALRRKLPEYMVPASFCLLEQLPLTPNGKVDRKALEARSDRPAPNSANFKAPRNSIEEQLARIWRDVLHLPEVGVQDNFFNLGGHSLLAIQVISRIREVFKVELPLFSLFTAPTIAAQAEGLVSGAWTANETAALPLQPRDPNVPIPLSFVQERLWFIHQLEPGSHAYNVPAALRLKGALEVAALEQALNEVIRRHEALRTTFQNSEGALTQVVSPSLAVEISTRDLRGLPGPQRESGARNWLGHQAQKPFDLARGPLLRAGLVRLADTEHIFLVVLHHTVSDGWSLAILFQELAALYEAYTNAKTATVLPELSVQYGDFACWQRETLHGLRLERELAFWKTNLQGAPPNIDLPTDHDPDNARRKAARLSRLLPPPLVHALTELGQREGATPFMLLMSALALTLSRWTGQNDLVLGTVVAGRNRRELENLLGCFMNFLPVRSRLSDSPTGKALLAATRQAVLEGQTHQDCPFEKIVEAINPERRLDRNPLYNVALLLQNFPSELFVSSSLQAAPVPVPMESPLLDLRFEAENLREGFSVTCEYRTDLFEETTIDHLLASFGTALEYLALKPDAPLAGFKLAPALEQQAGTARARKQGQTIAITATFTAEPIQPALRYWVDELELPAKIEFGPYHQVFQQLLDPGSLLASNQRGLNLVLLRLEDWQRSIGPTAESTPARSFEQVLNRNTADFIAALKTAVARTTTPFLVCVCPASPGLLQDQQTAGLLCAAENQLQRELEGVGGVYLLTSKQISDWYPVAEYHDPSGDELGHVPYAPLFFTALATAVARVFDALNRPVWKVIALDCDNTLWSGICGEDGAKGIRLDPPRQALQEFLRVQLDSGMLLALCSKNNEEDVNEVFAQRVDMPLRPEHFAAARLNWRAKSENLQSLAEELQLGLNSFIFLDDNPLECAEVTATCPDVLTLQLPEDPARIPDFLKHCWVLDHFKLTQEDRRRAESYRQNLQRERLRSAASSLADFLTQLELKIELGPMSPSQLPRVAQLTQRTNQFNTTTRRRSETELQQLVLQWEVTAVSVRDRFGDYGLTGAMVYRHHQGVLEVDSFLLSCRVLGRGVEHRMLACLGQLARALHAAWVDLHFVASPKNKPALDFLNQVGAQFRQSLNGGYLYRFPAAFAADVVFDPQPSEPSTRLGANDSSTRNVPPGAPRGAERVISSAPLLTRKFARWRAIALELSEPRKIHALVEQRQAPRSAQHATYAVPHNALETQLCELWESLLHVERVGVQDNFFNLGGHSLLAVRLFSEIEKLTGRKLPLVTIFQEPTIEQLARALTQHNGDSSASLLVPIQPHGSKPPLFLVHGAGGDVLWGYANLAGHLSANQPVYGIKSRGQLGLEECTTVPEMARCYLEAIRAFQPKGPYYLGGYCFGGNVAFEIARQLRVAHEEVALIALLDSAPANAGYERMTWWQPSFALRFARNFAEWFRDFATLESSVRRKFLARKLRSFGRKLKRRFAAPPGHATVDLEEVIDLEHFPENELKLWQIHLQALVKHTERYYPGQAVLLRTRGQALFCSLADDFCWGKVVQDGVKVVIIPGSHENIFMEPNVRTLARELSAILEQAQSRNVRLP